MRRKRILVGSALAAFLFLIGCGLFLYSLWSDRVALVEGQILAYLHAAGIDEVTLTLRSIDADGGGIEYLRLGPLAAPDLVLEDVRITYDLAALLRGQVAYVQIAKAHVRAELVDGRLRLGRLDVLLADGGANTEQVSMFDRVEIDTLGVSLSLPEGTIDLSGGFTIESDAGGLKILPTGGCVSLASQRLDVGAAFLGPISAVACLPDQTTSLSWPMAKNNSVQLSLSPVRIVTDAGLVVMTADVPSLTVTSGGDEAGSYIKTLGFSFAGAQLTLPGVEARFMSLDGQIEMSDMADLSGVWSLSNGRIKDLGGDRRFQPMNIAGSGRFSINHVDFDVMFSEPNLLVPIISAKGTHNIAGGRGNAQLALGPLRFDPKGLQPHHLSRAFKGAVTNVTGGLSGTFPIEWDRGALTSGGTMVFDELGFATAAARTQGVTGEVAFNSLTPPRTATPQQLKIARVDAGFMLEEGIVSFVLTDAGSIEIKHATWPFAGGHINLSSGVIEPAALEQALLLDVKNVDLEKFLDLLQFEGVSGTGEVNGFVPIFIRGGDVIIENAELHTATPGTLSYKSTAADAVSEGQSALLFQALEDFRYTGLKLHFDGSALDRLNVKLSLEGANPTLYDGYPFAINVTTEASFAELLRSATVGTRVLELIRNEGVVAE